MTELSPSLLRIAYAEGYFPMPDPDSGEIAWFRPDPRAILPLNGFHCSKSLERVIKKGTYRITYDQAFTDVMRGCADREETWITPEFIEVYSRLHRDGQAHSVEAWTGSR